jgi:hypothetical protein
VRRQHERRTGGNITHVVDEDNALATELLYHQAIVHDLVVAVNGGLEDTDHPRESLDGHLHARTEAAGLREEHQLDVAALSGRKGFLSRTHGRPG